MSSDNIDTLQTAETDDTDKVQDLINSILHRHEVIETENKKLLSETKKLIKSIHKKNTKKQKNQSTKSPSGFAKPSQITEELCKFLNKEVGTEMARTQVTKELNNYIKENKLQNPDKKKYINPDEKLKKLLKVDESFTYFELQKYMSHLFPKK